MVLSRLVAGAAAAALGAFASPASAALTFYTDYASWNAAVTGAVTTTTIADPAPEQFLSHGGPNSAVVYDGVTYGQSDAVGSASALLFTIGTLLSGSPAVVSSQTGLDIGGPNISISLPVDVFALAFNFGVFDFDEIDREVTIAVFGDEAGSVVRTAAGEAYEASQFFGVVSDGRIFAAQLTAEASSVHVRDVAYVAAIPEPSAWAMMLLGFGGLGAALRSRRRDSFILLR